MSIQTAIQNAQQKVANAYTAVSEKGGTLPATQNLSNLPAAIGSISSGGGDGIPRETSDHGEYQPPLTSFSFTIPNDATSIGPYCLYYAFRECQGITSVDLNNVAIIGNYSLSNAFYNCPNLETVDFSNVTSLGNYALQQVCARSTKLKSVDLSGLINLNQGSQQLNGAFQRCSALTSIDFSSLANVLTDGYTFMNAFSYCTSLTSVSFPSLVALKGAYCFGSAFLGCTALSNVSFDNLVTIGNSSAATNDNAQFSECFNNCTNLTTLSFPKLEKIYCTGSNSASYGTFYQNDNIQKLYFPKLDTITYGSGANTSNQNACKYIFSNCSSLTEIHFGASNQAAIEASPGYSTAWGRGAGNVTIYFDL